LDLLEDVPPPVAEEEEKEEEELFPTAVDPIDPRPKWSFPSKPRPLPPR